MYAEFLEWRRRIKPQMGSNATPFANGFQNRKGPPTLSHCTASRVARRDGMSNNRNVLYLIIGVLTVAVAVLGFNLYQAHKQPDGLQINVGPNGLKIESK
jgi:hypothetical protein